MSQFVVSARKYRPIYFKDVMSQPHITTTLKNAVAHNKLAHAFLFCGPRGVGKTTCARILAKTINCLSLTEEQEACNHCTHCVSFKTNGSMNIYELDAASNNSVEDIRELVEQIRYAPQVGKCKIYIIDEVHMLSNAAFNAFLKTLEEPPSYAIFILATTERSKVLPTILSRCQVFNFNRIQPQDIVEQLIIVANQENIAYEVSALQLIAQKAEGAMRDALSMFDLIAASIDTHGTITYATACAYLQALDQQVYFQYTEAFLKGEIATPLALYDQLFQNGFNGQQFIIGLGEHFRNLLVCKDEATIPLLEVTDNVRLLYAEHAAKCSISFLLQGLQLINQCNTAYKSSQNQRLHVEILLIELASQQLQSHPPKPSSPIKPQTSPVPTLQELRASLIQKTKTPEVVVKKKVESKANSVDIAKLQTFFTSYSDQLRKEGNIGGAHLIGHPIALQNGVITLTLINPLQEDTFKAIKEPLLAALRKAFGYSDMIIQTILSEQQADRKPYTDQEKLTYLSKKNSSIGLLTNRLLLEVSY